MRPSNIFHGDSELGGLASHFSTMVIIGELHGKGFAFSLFKAQCGSFKLRQHLTCANHKLEVFSFTTSKLNTIYLANEVDRHLIIFLSTEITTTIAMVSGLTAGVVMHALLA